MWVSELELPIGDFGGAAQHIQLLESSDRFVEASAVKTAPGVLVKLNWKAPPGKRVGLISTIDVGAGAISRMLEALGMPFKKTVTIAQPGGKLVTGKEANELVVALGGGQEHRLALINGAELHNRIIGG